MRRICLRKALQLLNMSNAEVADTNCPRLALFQQLLQGLPHLLSGLRSAARCVYQEQVHVPVLAIHLVHAFQHLRIRLVYAAFGEEDLGGKEDIRSLQS